LAFSRVPDEFCEVIMEPLMTTGLLSSMVAFAIAVAALVEFFHIGYLIKHIRDDTRALRAAS
jgi:hypothetical protein